MRHPFDIEPESTDDNDVVHGRRAFLGASLLAAAGAIALADEVLAQDATTMAVGEEGGKKPRLPTRALNEAGGKPTTEAEGEEGGKLKKPGLPKAQIERRLALAEHLLAEGDPFAAFGHMQAVRSQVTSGAGKARIAKIVRAAQKQGASWGKQADKLMASMPVTALATYLELSKLAGTKAAAHGAAELAAHKRHKMMGMARSEVTARIWHRASMRLERRSRIDVPELRAFLYKQSRQLLEYIVGKCKGTPTAKLVQAQLDRERNGGAKTTTKAIGEEGGRGLRPVKPPGRATTMAVGEEGGKKK